METDAGGKGLPRSLQSRIQDLRRAPSFLRTGLTRSNQECASGFVTFIESIIETELEEAASAALRPIDQGWWLLQRGAAGLRLVGTFGPVEISVARARLNTLDGNGETTEWKSRILPVYERRAKAADALIAHAYLSITNTRRVRRALATLSLKWALARRRTNRASDSR